MIEDIYKSMGLSRHPFTSAACTTGFFQTARTKAILEELYYGITTRKGFLVLEGEVGVGKTSTLYQLLAMLEKDKITTAWLFNSMLSPRDLLLAIAKDFGLSLADTASLASILEALHHFFIDQHTNDYNTAIIIDEAHNLEPPALEALRMLSNLEHDGQKLVQILLVGQPELKERIDHPNLRQLRSRISIYLILTALSQDECKRYVEFQLAQAGCELPVTPKAHALVWQGSLGNTRMVNLIMERALYAIKALGRTSLDATVITAALNDIAAYQIDVAHTLKSRHNKMTAVWSLGICAALILLALIPLLPTPSGPISTAQWAVHTWRQKHAPRQAVPAAVSKPSPPPQASIPPSIPQQVPQSDSSHHKEASPFLAKHGLLSLLPTLEQAVATNDLDRIRHKLPPNIQLIELDTLPSKRHVRFTFFPWEKYTGQSPQWIILWKPALRLKHFYPLYHSQNIALLQNMLNVLGYYKGKVDGLVGSLTWLAINAYQEKKGLPQTSMPDEKTLFYMYIDYTKKIQTQKALHK